MKKNNIAVTLPPYWEDSLEIMSNILILCRELENTKYKIFIKSHPNLDISKILSFLKLKQFPKNLTFSNENLEEILNSCLFVISMSTGAVYDAILNGNIVFNLESELQLASNYLDIFENDFHFLSASSVDSIKNTLLKFDEEFKFDEDGQKFQSYIEEFGRLRNHLTKGMNVVNDLHLSKFKLG